MYSQYKYGDLSVTTVSSANPGRVTITERADRRQVVLDMSVHEAVEMAFSFLEAARMQGFDVVARKRRDR